MSDVEPSPDGKVIDCVVRSTRLFLLDENGVLLDRYDKIELLAFGEYVPFVEYFPKFYEWENSRRAR